MYTESEDTLLKFAFSTVQYSTFIVVSVLVEIISELKAFVQEENT